MARDADGEIESKLPWEGQLEAHRRGMACEAPSVVHGSDRVARVDEQRRRAGVAEVGVRRRGQHPERRRRRLAALADDARHAAVHRHRTSGSCEDSAELTSTV